MARNDLIFVIYEDDFGNEFVTQVNSEVYNQPASAGVSVLGGTIPVSDMSNMQALPASVKPRRAYMKNDDGEGRYVIALTPTSALATNPATTIELDDSGDNTSTYHRAGSIRPEYFGKLP